MALSDQEQKERYDTLMGAAGEAANEAKASEGQAADFFKGVAVGLAAGAKALEVPDSGQ